MEKNTIPPYAIYNKGAKQYGFLFTHGLGGTKEHHNNWIRHHNVHCHSFNLPHVTPTAAVDLLKVNLAQEDDIEAHKKAYEIFLTTLPADSSIIAEGISLGGATTLSACAKNNYQNLAGIIVESPFATAAHSVQHQVGQVITGFLARSIPLKIYNRLIPFVCKKYNPDGPNPLKLCTQIPKEVPILLIHSKQDQVISMNDSRELYVKLKESDHNVYLCELNKGRHCFYPDNKECAKVYYQTIDAFLRSINTDLGVNGIESVLDTQAYLKTLQPSPKKVRKDIYNSTRTERWIRRALVITALSVGVYKIISKFKLFN